MKRGYDGKLPCPGCQEHKWRRSKDQVCDTCAEHIRLGKVAKEQANAGGQTSMRIKRSRYRPGRYSMPDGHSFNRKEYPHATLVPPYISNFMSKETRPDSKWFNDHITEFLTALSVDESVPIEFNVYCEDGTYSSDFIYLDSKQGLAWLKFYDALAQYTIEVERRAYEKGQDLLMQLANEGLGFTSLQRKENDAEDSQES